MQTNLQQSTPFVVSWQPRTIPLTPVAVVGRGEVGRALGFRVLRGSETERAGWRGMAGGDILLILGDSDTLPWADGVVYLGRDPAAPALLVPTSVAPSVPLPLLERALRTQFPALAPPLALLPDAQAILPAGTARPLVPARLAAWLTEAVR